MAYTQYFYVTINYLLIQSHFIQFNVKCMISETGWLDY